MTIFHEVYLFDRVGFVRDLVQLECAGEDESIIFQRARAEAFGRYERSQFVRHLLDFHGGWNRDALLAQFPAASQSTEDLAMWLVMLLYDRLSPPSDGVSLGLGNSWQQCLAQLQDRGWPPDERESVVFGRRVESLFEDRRDSHNSNLMTEALKQVQPPSTVSRIGWLPKPEAEKWLAKLSLGERQPRESESEAISGVRRYLEVATVADRDLCCLVSG